MTHIAVAEFGRVPIGPRGFSRTEAQLLLAAARAHPLKSGQGENIVYERNNHLHVGQLVGVLSAPGCSIEILPKLDTGSRVEQSTLRERLVQMLDVALRLNIGRGDTAGMARGAPSLLDILIAHFAELLLAETRRGLPRAYFGHEDDLGTLRGRLDPVRQFTRLAVRPERLACRFDVLGADTPMLQLMKACVVRVIPSARRANTRRMLDELRIVLGEISDVAPARLAKNVQLDRTNSRWRTLLRLARLLLADDWQTTNRQVASTAGISLLFPMNDLFEAYVAALARRALAPHDIEVKAQGGGVFCLAPWVEGQDDVPGGLFATKPDLMFYRGGRLVTIVDTKWKLLSTGSSDRKRGVSQADVYQLMAYAQLYRADRLLLLYPHHSGLGTEGTQAQHRIAVHGGARLDIATLSLNCSRGDCAQALRSLLLPLCNPLEVAA